jgi:medium-chain acyl-[acyl-carrier-protein] hydrolase
MNLKPTRYNQWVMTRVPRPSASYRLLCFPHAGGSSVAYRSWDLHLPSIEVCCVTLPGRDTRFTETAMTCARQIGSEVASAIQGLPVSPWIFYGHSMGAILAFEAIRALRRQAVSMPVHLFVSGCRAPHVPDSEPFWHKLSDAELVNQLRETGGTDRQLIDNLELLSLLMPIIRADAMVTEKYLYEPETPLEIPITAFYGKEDRLVPNENVLAWRSHTISRFSSYGVDGNHFFNSSVDFIGQLGHYIEMR